MITDRSTAFFESSQTVIPGGVNSPVRACKSVDELPRFIDRADGCRLFDADGNAYIDYVGSWGPMILGHRHPAVIQAITDVLARGTSFGAPTELELELALRVTQAVPSVEMVRMVNSGTEAAMSAIRLARGATGRNLVIKFDGCYHGHADTLLVAAGSGVATLNIPGSPGVPEDVVRHTLSLPYNDPERFRAVMAAKGDDVAAVIVEPVAGNMGMVPPAPGFLETLREETATHGSLLIFDEVMCGFRVAYGGAQELYGIRPDVSCFGKIIGGGLPVGAYGGKQEIMDYVAPTGPVYQAGTLSGNPLAMRAGHAVLSKIAAEKDTLYDTLEDYGRALEEGMHRNLDALGLDFTTNRVGAMASLFFTDQQVVDQEAAKTTDTNQYAAYFHAMLEEGIYLPPSQFEAIFFGNQHGEEELDATLKAQRTALKQVT